MLSPEYLDDCANQLINLYSELENRIIADIVRRLLKTGDITETAKWEILKAQELGLLYDDVLSLIASQTNKTNAEVKTLFENAGVETVNIDNEKYRKAGKVPVDVRQSESMRQVLEAGYQKTLGNLRNLTMTTAITSQTAFINASNSAYMMVTSGAFSYQDAIRTAIKEMAQKGVSVLTDTIKYEGTNKKGQHYTHEDKIDIAIRRNVLTGVGQTCKQVSLTNAKENGFDLMEINAHSGARPSHAKWQGKRVSLSGRKGYLSLHDIGYGSAEGFGGCNCRHDWYPVDENDVPMYTDSQLQDFDAKNIEYNGKKYTQYEATQIQRRKEREIRDLKREAVAYDTAIKETDDEELKSKLKDDFTKTSNKLKDKEKALANFTKETGIKRDKFREQVQGFNRSVSSKSTWADKKSQNSLSTNNRYLKNSLRQPNYKWNSKDNIEKAKYNVQNYPLESRIEKIKEKISKYGLKEDYIHEAGNCLLDDMIVLYDKSNQNKNIYKQLKKQLDNKISNRIYNEEVEELFKKMQYMEVIENHSLVLKNTLSRIRKVGYDNKEVYNHLNGSDRISVDIVAQAYQYLPEDWVKSSLQKGKIVVQYKERGQYQNVNNTLLTDNTLRTSIHELVHRMEYTHKGLLQAEKQFYDRRTKNENLTKLIDIFPDSSYEDWEVTRKDKFVNPYMGKDYNGDAYELLTMGLELLYSNPEKIWKDKDMTTWLYGILALL